MSCLMMFHTILPCPTTLHTITTLPFLNIMIKIHRHASNNIPSFNSFNITINSPQNISEVFRHGFKIVIMPVTDSDVRDQPQQDYTYLDRSSDNSQIQFQQ
ncbi:hypothetical protein C1645_832892 [Glomus cerebriforme]|uniref:Uncharacterized protein n=1 Tax=Glomus cerebriforme TaxID=658196 RepID=A0A397SGK3_9GLOM|nr:hypothetical protein C1645_832892 [Glomus cerebriforme]